jgi:Spy/CpxP family protein refolding chaperone
MSVSRFRAIVCGAVLLPLMTILGCAPMPPPSPFEGQVPARPVLGEQVPLITLMLWHARDLSLTAEQARALEALRGDFQRAADLQTAELQRIELELQGLLSREQIDMSQVETKIRKIEALRTDLRLGRIKTVEKGKTILTPEQWRKVQPLIRGGP